jgi:hypothetical protein
MRVRITQVFTRDEDNFPAGGMQPVEPVAIGSHL